MYVYVFSYIQDLRYNSYDFPSAPRQIKIRHPLCVPLFCIFPQRKREKSHASALLVISLGPGEGGAADGVESHGKAGQERVKCLRFLHLSPVPGLAAGLGVRVLCASPILDPIRSAVAFPRACTLGSWDDSLERAP